jgi:myo-inositol 2-dehydrogenase/D-chiro-inositol 1-dehydrogenase
MSTPLGVGIIGAGPVTQAIHLPTLSTLYDRLRVVHVMDVNHAVAASVAARTGARSTTDVQSLLNDPAVDVVAICSPHQFHADQVEEATKAGKRAILCEKPLATTVEQAQRIADVSASSGVPVIVGAMHVHDPAFGAASRAWGQLPDEATLVRVVVYLPSNDELVDLSTDLAAPAPAPPPPGDLSAPASRAAAVRAGVLGLATHNLPLVRRFVPSVEEVLSAGFVAPFGYELTFRSGDTVAQLLALMPGRWRPDWSLHAFGPGCELHVQFPPSYVLAGSATATVATATSQTSWRYPRNGYQAEWLHLADVAEGRSELAIPVQEAVDDLLYALRLADGADALILEER